MPLFDFKCSKCGEVYEVLLKADESAPTNCPPGPEGAYPGRGCKAEDALRKQLSAPSIELKGSGWYRDGYS